MSSIHDQLGQRAVDLLTPEEKSFWSLELAHLPDYCFFPDLHLGSQWEAPEKEAFYGRYCLMPNGKCIPHGPVDHLWQGCNFFGNEIAAEAMEYICTYYLKTIVKYIKEKNPMESARFAGTLAHFIQDCCTPGHVVNNIMLNHMFPNHGKSYIHLHAYMDSFPLPPPRPFQKIPILGESLDEAAYLLSETLRGETEAIVSEMVPLCQAIQAGRMNKKGEKILHKHQERAILWSAALWHTAFQLAQGKKKTLLHLKKQDLTQHPMMLEYGSDFDRKQWIEAEIPFYPTHYAETDPCRSRLATIPYPYEPLINQALDRQKKLNPLWLTMNGVPFLEKSKGIAMGSYGVASYRVPGKIYKEFDCWCGVHPLSPNNGEIHFAIWCHEAPQHLLFHKTCHRGEDAIHIQIELPRECKTLSLLTAGPDAFGSSALWLNPIITTKKQ